MSHLRPNRGGESRRSVFYTPSTEEWEMVDPPTKDTSEQKAPAESQRRESPSHLHRRERLSFLVVASDKLKQNLFSFFIISVIVVVLACFFTHVLQVFIFIF